MPLILDWHPDYWTSDERSQLFDFWRDRYGRHPLNLSPSGSLAGGVGFFDAGMQSVRFRTSLHPSDSNHPLTQEFQRRRAHLEAERETSQAADRHRLQLLLVAEQTAWEWWKVFETYRPRLFDGPILRQQSSERIQRHEAIYKDALAQLIEHDREHGHPLADPDRDWTNAPPTSYERRRWLTRRGRTLDAEDARLLDEGLKNNEGLRRDLGRVAPRPRAGFIPSRLERWHEKQVEQDQSNGITRSKSGVGVRRSMQSEEAEKPPAPLVVSRAGDLTEKVQHFLTMRDDVRRGANEVPDLNLPVPAPSGAHVKPEPPTAKALPPASETFLDDILDDLVAPNADALEPAPLDSDAPLPEDEDGEDDQGQAEGSRGAAEGHGDGDPERPEDMVEEPGDLESRRVVAESDTPSWFQHGQPKHLGALDPSAPTLPTDGVRRVADASGEALPDGNVRELYSEALREVLPMKRPTSTDDTFERERRLREITEKWKARNVSQLSAPEPENAWDRAVSRVASFKDRAISLWNKRVAPNLGLETPQQRLAAQAKAQDLLEIKKLIKRLEATTPKPKAKGPTVNAPPPPAPPAPGRRRR